MVSIKEHLEELLESFDYSGDVEERIRLLRAAIGRVSNIFYGTESEEIYADQVRRIKLRLRELRERLTNCEDDKACWRELMDNLEELRDQIERLAIRGDIIEK
ncbi:MULTISPECIES: hypothetical protein [unclassified Archaeoglobus]|jgi:DNA repair exonuclease SbcCD ATPase subunit|uniref:hypothetical protein n=1 Tax=unclassified Archaeoglobus TaxID=2643606 RepID=UPI0025B8E677|nr:MULTISPECIES: hypothetical protein [unclassified Archaeoglobus]